MMMYVAAGEAANASIACPRCPIKVPGLWETNSAATTSEEPPSSAVHHSREVESSTSKCLFPAPTNRLPQRRNLMTSTPKRCNVPTATHAYTHTSSPAQHREARPENKETPDGVDPKLADAGRYTRTCLSSVCLSCQSQ